jgi:hypothetical protein
VWGWVFTFCVCFVAVLNYAACEALDQAGVAADACDIKSVAAAGVVFIALLRAFGEAGLELG